jgi:hypothetical protein
MTTEGSVPLVCLSNQKAIWFTWGLRVDSFGHESPSVTVAVVVICITVTKQPYSNHNSVTMVGKRNVSPVHSTKSSFYQLF